MVADWARCLFTRGRNNVHVTGHHVTDLSDMVSDRFCIKNTSLQILTLRLTGFG